jgi:hypothetical protein
VFSLEDWCCPHLKCNRCKTAETLASASVHKNKTGIFKVWKTTKAC